MELEFDPHDLVGGLDNYRDPMYKVSLQRGKVEEVPTDNVTMGSIVGTPEGRIFMAGSDGAVYVWKKLFIAKTIYVHVIDISVVRQVRVVVRQCSAGLVHFVKDEVSQSQPNQLTMAITRARHAHFTDGRARGYHHASCQETHV